MGQRGPRSDTCERREGRRETEVSACSAAPGKSQASERRKDGLRGASAGQDWPILGLRAQS